MSGLFHLHPVAKFSRQRDTPLEGILGKAIRDCTDREQGRDVPLEDFCYDVLSFWGIRNDVFLVRFANVNDKGKPFGNITVVQTLVDVTISMLRAKTHVYTPVDSPTKYEHFYTPKEFEGSSFLWVPNNSYVRTMVVSYRR